MHASSNTPRITPAHLPEDADIVRDLLLEYAEALPGDADLCVESLDAEIAGLLDPAPSGVDPASGGGGMYQAPRGRFLLAIAEVGQIAGGVGLRPLDEAGHPGTAELRRLYIRPDYRGRHLGRWLAMAAIYEAMQAGYRRVRLETTAGMTAAQSLYESMGFRDIPVLSADDSIRTMELELDPIDAARP